MNRIDQLFSRKTSRVLNVYCTAGFPYADSTLHVMEALQEAGADMIELGMPYSDPLADGPVIQASSARAIANGMTIGKLFTSLAEMRQRIFLPVILMGYLNPILRYGFERFCRQAAAVGVDGLILPDLPMREYREHYQNIIDGLGLRFTFLVTPETSDARIRELDNLSTGFLYAVSSSSTTGNEKAMSPQLEYFARLKRLNLKNPILIGFGIKDKQTFDTAAGYVNGAIIGTAYIRALQSVATDTPVSGEQQPDRIREVTKAFIDDIIK